MKHLLFSLCFLAGLASSASIQKRGGRAWPLPVRNFYTEVNHEIKAIRAVGELAAPPACNASAAVMPSTNSSSFPKPSDGLLLYHVAVGRGTQNYTCDSNLSSSVPTAAGAVASLFNASCVAEQHPNLLSLAPPAALTVPSPVRSEVLFPANIVHSGNHYFVDATTPVFNLHTQNTNYGIWFAKKVANTTAPTDAAKGPDGSAAVPWLKLEVQSPPEGADTIDCQGGVKEIFRINTAGGSPPKTCEGMPPTFQVEYAAEYWFWAAPSI